MPERLQAIVHLESLMFDHNAEVSTLNSRREKSLCDSASLFARRLILKADVQRRF